MIETERLYLRPITIQDFDFLSKLFADPDVMKFSADGPFSIEKTKKVLETMLATEKTYGIGTYVVIKKEEKQSIGIVGLAWEESKPLLAYRFLKPYWEFGYATEALKFFVTHCFKNLNILYAYIQPENKASIKVAEKIGMTFMNKGSCHTLPANLYQIKKDA